MRVCVDVGQKDDSGEESAEGDYWLDSMWTLFCAWWTWTNLVDGERLEA